MLRRYVLAHEVDRVNRPPSSLWRSLNEQIGVEVWTVLKKVAKDEKIKRALATSAFGEAAKKNSDAPGASHSDAPLEIKSDQGAALDIRHTTAVNANNPPEYECSACGRISKSHLRCSGCRLVYYCNRNCQKDGWKHHKSNCKNLHKQATPSSQVDARFTTSVPKTANPKNEEAISVWDKAIDDYEAAQRARKALGTNKVSSSSNNANVINTVYFDRSNDDDYPGTDKKSNGRRIGARKTELE